MGKIKLMNHFLTSKVLMIFIFVHSILLILIDFFPYPELFIYPYLTQKGLTPYKQIFDQHFPGMMFFPLNLASLGIDTPPEMRLLQVLVVIINHLLIYLVSKHLLKGMYRILPNILYLLWQPFFEGYVVWIDSIMPIFLLSSYYFFIRFFKKGSLVHIFTVGLLLGFGLLFKQVVLPIILFCLLVLVFKYKSAKIIGAYLLGISIPIVVLLIYIISIDSLNEFIFWTATFNITTFAQLGRKYPTVSDLIKTLPVFIFAALSTLSLIRNRIKSEILLTGFFFTSLLFAYARFDFVHLQPALPFALLAITIFVSRYSESKKNYFLLFAFVSLIFNVYFYKKHFGKEVYFWGSTEAKIVEKVKNLTNEGDTIFALATFPHIYHLTGTLPPGKVFVFQFPWFMLEAEDKILSGIAQDMPKLILRDPNSMVDGLSLIKYEQKIDSFVNQEYYLLETIDKIQVWLKK